MSLVIARGQTLRFAQGDSLARDGQENVVVNVELPEAEE